MDNSFGYGGGSSFGISCGDGKGGVVPRTTQNFYQKMIFGLMVVVLCHL